MNKAWIGAAAAVLALPALAFGGLLGLASTFGAAQGGNGVQCSSGGSPELASSTTASPVALSAAQLGNASTIINVGRSLNVPTQGIEVALMVGMAESNLRNLANTTVPESMQYPNDGTGNDHDSVGIFQQRANWGSVKDRMTPEYAARAFFGGPSGPNAGSPRGLLDVANWQGLIPAKAAQAVQVSFDDTGSNYAKFQSVADQLLGFMNSSDTGSCAGQGSTATGNWKGPNGRTGQDLVQYAEQFVGKVPYAMNCGAAGNPTVGWCCTGFVYYVYDQVLGLQVPGAYVKDELTNFHQIPSSQAQAGDVVAWPNEHVGIYDGNGGVIHSPDFGRMLTHTPSLFDVDGIAPVFYRANALGGGNW